MPRSLALQELAELLRVLAHPDRIRIVEELRDRECDVGELADLLGVPSARVSQHLSVLRAHHVVTRRRDGRRRYYHLQNPTMAAWLIQGLDYLQIEIEALQDSIADARQRFGE